MIHLLCMMLLWIGTVEATDAKPWAIFYGEDVAASTLKPYHLLVFDSDAHPSLEQFKGQDKVILGYLSLGEIEQHRSHFDDVQKEGLILGQNTTWEESHFVDLRDPRWAKRVIEELIPGILFQRFDGIFLDTLDNAGYLEEKDPQKYRGMREGAIHLVRAIRMHYPQIKIMMNRAFDLLPDVSRDIDMLLGESLYTEYDFTAQRYKRAPEKQYAEQVERMQAAKVTNPKLELYSLDYWDPADTSMVKEIYRTERKNGLDPYVSTVELTTIYPEPQ